MTVTNKLKLRAGDASLALRATEVTGDQTLLIRGDYTPNEVARINAAGTELEFVPVGDLGISNTNGTVTSVGLSAPNIFSVGNSPVTTAGTLNLGLETQAAGLIFSGPGTGPDAAPTFRALLPSDVPNLPAGKITSGTLPIARLPVGTGATDVAAGNDARFHDQNTDTGTTATSFQVDSGSNGPRIANSSGVMEVLDAAGTGFASLRVSELLIDGDPTRIAGETVTFSDNILELNSNFTAGAPTENAGFRVKRGDEVDGALLWIENTDGWFAGSNNNLKAISRYQAVNFTAADVTGGEVVLTHDLNRLNSIMTVYDNQGASYSLEITEKTANTATVDVSGMTITGTWVAAFTG